MTPTQTVEAAWCTRCDGMYGRQSAKAVCPACGCPNWSIRPRAEAEALVESNLTYALRLAAIRARTKRPIREEIESAALLGLTLAARRWDSRRLSPKTGKPVIFSTYMVHAVTSAINREIATQRAAIARRTCAPDELEFDDDGKLTGARRAGKPYQLAAEREDEAIILAAIGQLRPVHQAILHARIDGATFREIGDQIGRTKQGAQQIMATAQRRLTKLLAAS